MSSGNKLRILALHGWKQNGAALKSKCGALRKATSDVAEFFFVDAPHQDADGGPDERTWWSFNADFTQYGGVDESVQAVRAALREHAPIHGLFGFSQGSGVISYLLARAANDDKFEAPELRAVQFAILVSGFKPRDTAMQPLFKDGSIRTPTLVVIGDADTIIKPEVTLQQATLFADVTIAHHLGGHNVANRATVGEMLDFLARFRSAETETEET